MKMKMKMKKKGKSPNKREVKPSEIAKGKKIYRVTKSGEFVLKTLIIGKRVKNS